jgi:mono/diheme cytochrome c family protein
VVWLFAIAVALSADAERGAWLADVAGCASCHTATGGEAYAGGHALPSKWGTFYGSNLTSDDLTGLGRWAYDDFERALRKGRSPKGRHYYPSFPYASFTRMTDGDLLDLWAFFQQLPAVSSEVPAHEMRFPYGMRFSLAFWKLLYLDKGPDPAMDRGAYIGTAWMHCGDCHTPRNGLGAPRKKLEHAGAESPPAVGPNITSHAHGLQRWSDADLMDFFESGETPESDFTGGEMARVVRDGTARLSEEDRAALTAWVQSRSPRPSLTPPETEVREEESW